MRRLAILLTCLVIPAIPTSNAAADLGDRQDAPPPTTEVGYDPDAVGVVAGYDYVEPREVTSPNRNVPPGRRRICGFFAYNPDNPPGVAQQPEAPIAGDDYWVVCRWEDTGDVAGIAAVQPYDPADPTGGLVVTETMVTAYMLSLFDFAVPDVQFAPPPGNQVVNLETWIGWRTDPPGQTRTAQAGPVWSQGIATPIAATIDFGTGLPGSIITCREFEPAYTPDRPADAQRPACGRYTYATDSRDQPDQRYPATVTLTYDIWVTTSETATPFLAATVTGPPLAVGMDVAQLQAVIR
ncbi:MAG: hypothetical protein HKN26_05050 [Acidimicrobiales bacterium]|nr:hypothetical protein [Acidimicrobiales bacterium]